MDKNTKEIKKILKRELDLETFDEDFETNMDGMDVVFHILETEGLISFSIRLSTSIGGCDFWLEAIYFSEKLQMSVILDQEFRHNYNTLDEIVEKIQDTELLIEELEDKIMLK